MRNCRIHAIFLLKLIGHIFKWIAHRDEAHRYFNVDRTLVVCDGIVRNLTNINIFNISNNYC